MPAKALIKLAAEPDNAPLAVLSVIAPVVAALIVTSCATVGASLIVIAASPSCAAMAVNPAVVVPSVAA